MADPSKLPPQPWMTAPGTQRILAALTHEGTRVRFVGGCVRNALIGQAVGDLDAATPDDPETVTRLLGDAGLKAIPTGVEHGTVTAVSGATVIEITTLRRDVQTDGRHAQVAFTADWSADARRRDFTMNAIYADPDGTLFDPQGGIPDLMAGRVRFIGDARERIREDYLRILRFFRFHVWYGRGALDAQGLAAAAAEVDGLAQLSGERMQKELLRLLAAPAGPAATIEPPHLIRVLTVMREAGVLAHLLPGPLDLPRLETLMHLEQSLLDGAVDALLRLGALIVVPGLSVDPLCERLKLSNRMRARLAAMAAPEPAVTSQLNAKAARRMLYRLGVESFTDRLLLTASATRNGARGKVASLLALADAWDDPQLPVNGQDIINAGFTEGPEVGRVLEELEAYWIARDFRPKRAELLKRMLAMESP